jgi:hypothetical protein
MFGQIQVIANKHLKHRIIAVKDGERRILLRNMAGGESEIRAKSTDNPVSLLGEPLAASAEDEAPCDDAVNSREKGVA